MRKYEILRNLDAEDFNGSIFGPKEAGTLIRAGVEVGISSFEELDIVDYAKSCKEYQ